MAKMKVNKYLIVVIFTTVITKVIEGNTCQKIRTLKNSERIRTASGTEEIIVRYGHYAEFDCCSENAVNVTWAKLNKATGKWETYNPESADVNFYENKQVLTIKSVSFGDDGLYKCVVNTEKFYLTETREFQLSVVTCDMLARGPYPIFPLPCTDTVTSLDAKLTLPCSGYFGCTDDGETSMNIVKWFVSRDKSRSDDWIEANSFDKRYISKDFERDGGSVKGSNLIINGVKNEDFGRRFMCLLASPQEIQGQSRVFVTLRKNFTEQTEVASLSPLVAIVLGIVLIVFLVTVTAALVWKCCHGNMCMRNQNTSAGKKDRCFKWKTVANTSDEDQV